MANNSSSSNRRTTHDVNATPPSTGPRPHDQGHPPPILGMLEPPPSRRDQRAPANIPDPSGAGPLRNQQNRLPLLDFPQVPQQLDEGPGQSQGHQFETWFRLHRRFEYNDANARVQEPDWSHRADRAARLGARRWRNQVNMRRSRARIDGNRAIDWSRLERRQALPDGTFVEAVAWLTPVQIAHNTNWTVTAGGIHPPSTPGHLFPLDTFLERPGQPHRPGQMVLRALAWVHADGNPANLPAEYTAPPLLGQATARQNQQPGVDEHRERFAAAKLRMNGQPGKRKSQTDKVKTDRDDGGDEEAPLKKKPRSRKPRPSTGGGGREPPTDPNFEPLLTTAWTPGDPRRAHQPLPNIVPPSHRREDEGRAGVNRPAEDAPGPRRSSRLTRHPRQGERALPDPTTTRQERVLDRVLRERRERDERSANEHHRSVLDRAVVGREIVDRVPPAPRNGIVWTDSHGRRRQGPGEENPPDPMDPYVYRRQG